MVDASAVLLNPAHLLACVGPTRSPTHYPEHTLTVKWALNSVLSVHSRSQRPWTRIYWKRISTKSFQNYINEIDVYQPSSYSPPFSSFVTTARTRLRTDDAPEPDDVRLDDVFELGPAADCTCSLAVTMARNISCGLRNSCMRLAAAVSRSDVAMAWLTFDGLSLWGRLRLSLARNYRNLNLPNKDTSYGWVTPLYV